MSDKQFYQTLEAAISDT